MRRILCTTGFTMLLSALCGCGGISMDRANRGAPTGTGFMVKTVNIDGVDRHYGLFIPHDYTAASHKPVIVFLHGIMEGGNNGTSNMGVGLGPAVARRAETFPFIVVFPQSPGEWKGAERARIAIACLDQVQHDYSTDPGRVILTGLSNGGYGTWAIGAAYKTRFSALVPMCAYTDYEDVPSLVGIPIRCYHNSGDFLVPAGGSEEMFSRIKAAGGNMEFIKYGDIGHNCWDRAYDDPELFQWMQAARKS